MTTGFIKYMLVHGCTAENFTALHEANARARMLTKMNIPCTMLGYDAEKSGWSEIFRSDAASVKMN